MNQELEIYLRHFVNQRQDDWVDWIPLAEFAIANRQSSATGFSPFFVTQGQNPWTGNPLMIPTNHPNEAVTNFVTQMDTVQKEIQESLEKAQRVMKETYDQQHRPITFAIDELVW